MSKGKTYSRFVAGKSVSADVAVQPMTPPFSVVALHDNSALRLINHNAPSIFNSRINATHPTHTPASKSQLILTLAHIH
jgi:hypothetical protein